MDRLTVRAVHNAAFRGDADVAETRLVDELRADGDVIPALSIVAVLDGDVVGHVICSRASIDDRPAIGLGPLSVSPAYQRWGVGQALMPAVLAAADALDEPAVGLLGDSAYYSRFGLAAGATLGVLPPHRGGTFRYARAFDCLL